MVKPRQLAQTIAFALARPRRGLAGRLERERLVPGKTLKIIGDTGGKRAASTSREAHEEATGARTSKEKGAREQTNRRRGVASRGGKRGAKSTRRDVTKETVNELKMSPTLLHKWLPTRSRRPIRCSPLVPTAKTCPKPEGKQVFNLGSLWALFPSK